MPHPRSAALATALLSLGLVVQGPVAQAEDATGEALAGWSQGCFRDLPDEPWENRALLHVRNLSGSSVAYDMWLDGQLHTQFRLPAGGTDRRDLVVDGPHELSVSVAGRTLASTTVTGQECTGPRTVRRIAGEDRYQTAALVAEQVSAQVSGRAYAASGQAWADALPAAAAAAGGVVHPRSTTFLRSPVLLVRQDGVPAATRAALEELALEEIRLVGGPGPVGPPVEDQLAAHAGRVERLGGADRYQTAAAVALREGEEAGEHRTFVATGSDFADALSAAGAAGASLFGEGRDSMERSVLLTRSDRLTTVTAQVLKEQQPYTALVGGPTALSARVAQEVAEIIGEEPWRFDGDDRYQVSVALSQQFFYGHLTPTVVVAAGHDYPDALAAAPLGAALRAPVLLVASDAVPAVVLAELDRLAPLEVVIVGGPSAVSPEVEEQIRARMAGWDTDA